LLNEGAIFEGDILIENEFIKEIDRKNKTQNRLIALLLMRKEVM